MTEPKPKKPKKRITLCILECDISDYATRTLSVRKLKVAIPKNAQFSTEQLRLLTKKEGEKR